MLSGLFVGLPMRSPACCDQACSTKHFTYALAAAKMPGEVESSGSQFYITTGTPHHLDDLHTIFGRIVEGHTVVDKIGTATVVGDRPEQAVTVLSTVVM